MVGRAKVEGEDMGSAEAMPEEEDSVGEAEVEAEEAAGPQPLIPMTQAGATLQLNGGS